MPLSGAIMQEFIMKNRFFKSLLTTALLIFHLPAPAEDIDLFVNATGTSSNAPNVLFIIDNTANWEQAFTNEMASLSNTFANLTNGGFRVGIMFAAETGKDNNNKDGGYVRAAIRTMDSTTKPLYQSLVNSLDKGNDKGTKSVAGHRCTKRPFPTSQTPAQ